MDPERWQRLKKVFGEASELAPPERAAFLDQACEGDSPLRADVERLLRQDQETEILLAPDKPHALAEGDLLADRFRIVRFVGKGGMGEVYQAEDLVLGGMVALKTMRPDLLDDPTFLSRFRREVLLARQVTHRNICRMFDVGQHDPRAGRVVFLTMEYLEGETLQKVLARRGTIPPDEALTILRQLAAGLEALHSQSIIHRDLKPGNVMLTTSDSGSPRAVITDFGLARAESQGNDASLSTALSQSGQLLGTPDYMAPEQLLGQALTPAADVYSLGLIAYEMVTGMRPFAGPGNALRRLTEAPTPPRTHAPGLSQTWETAIFGCLARDPANRIPDAMGLIAALDGTRPVPVAATPRRPVRRIAIFAAAIAGIFLALSVTGWRLGRRSGEQARRAEVRHVAVMPFTLLEEDPSVRVFADGLMESITGRLSQYEGVSAPIQVVPSSEVRQQRAQTASDAAKLLGVNTAVEGRVQSQGGRVRLMLTVIDTREKRQLDTIVTEGQRQNSMGIQDDAVAKLANALDLRVQTKYARDMQKLTPAAPGAHEYYLQARGYLQRNDKVESVDTSITLLGRALEIDKGYAPAVAALGEAYWYKYDLTKEKVWADRAIETCQRAVTMNSSLPEAHVTMGLVLNGTGRYGEALKEFEQAIAIDPRDNSAYQGMANAYTNLKEFEKAEATYLKAISLRPGDWSGYKALGLFHYRRAEYSKAIEQWERGASLTPDNAQVFVNLGAAYYFKGDLEGARKNLERALELDPNRVSTLQNLGNLYYEQGELDRAIEIWSRAVKQSARSYRLWGALASAYRRKGDEPKMMEAVSVAAGLVESEMTVNANRADLYTFLAHFRAMQGKPGARELVDRAIRMSPEDPDILVRAAETLQYLGEDGAALSLMRRAVNNGYSASVLRRSPTLGALAAKLKTNNR